MSPWQERVIAERDQLRERLNRLIAFGVTPEYEALPFVEKLDLALQGEHMHGYWKALQRRIERFK
jgi:hypothetical protein